MLRLTLRMRLVSLVVVVLPFLMLAHLCLGAEVAGGGPHLMQASADRVIQNLPLMFEQNLGQANPDVVFLARMPQYTMLLGTTQAIIAFQEKRDVAVSGRRRIPSAGTDRQIRLSLLGANAFGGVRGESGLAAQSNYFIGNDPGLWRTNVPSYSRVRYASVYKNVDLIYYGSEGNLEYDFIVHPGGNTKAIEFALGDATAVGLQPTGDLLICAGDSKIELRRPVAYQVIGGQRRGVEARFRHLGKQSYGIQVGAYDRQEELIIDPVLVYSTYLGGSEDEGIFGIAFDADRNIYLAGETSSVNFPTRNPLQPQVGGSYDAFVSKFDPTGKRLIYSTYLGGSGYDHAVGLRVDELGRVYLAGLTASLDFPIKNALQPTKGAGPDGFVAKLDRSGSKLIFSTYLGGNGFDQVNAITLGRDQSIYVTGFTNSSDFPTTTNALSTKCDGGVQPFCVGDGFVAKLDSGGQTLLYSTYVGGSSYDSAAGIAVDSDGHAYITGQTNSADFPVNNGYQPTFGGLGDAFVVKLNESGSKSVWSTYLGGSGFDNGTDIALDHRNNVYVTGLTASTNFPLAHAFQSTNKGGQFDGFVTKLNAEGSQLVYSTYIGGSGLDFPFRIAVRREEAAIFGFTSSTDFPLQAPLQAAYAGGNTDAFVAHFNREGDQLRFSTYLGGSGDEYGYAITLGCDGSIWIGGSTSSTDFPLVNPFQAAYGGGPFDAFLTRVTEEEDGSSAKLDTADRSSNDCFREWGSK